MANKKIKIFSFFSGCGFLDLGFEKNGYEIVLVNEFFKPFLDAYKYARLNMGIPKPMYGYWNTDINRFLSDDKNILTEYIKDARDDGSLVGFIGGPPCPDFSVAGKNRGKEGENGKLSRSYADLIIDAKPDFFLFENVKGLWRTARHRAFFEELKSRSVYQVKYSQFWNMVKNFWSSHLWVGEESLRQDYLPPVLSFHLQTSQSFFVQYALYALHLIYLSMIPKFVLHGLVH